MQENLALILVGSILVNNFVMSRFYGTCPFLGVSKQVSTALGMGVAVTFVMGVASLVTYFVQYYILEPLELAYLQTIAFILVIAVLVQLVEMVINKTSPSLYKALGVYLPLITTNCAVLGVTILNITEEYSLLGSVVNGVGSALGFTLAIVLFAVAVVFQIVTLPVEIDASRRAVQFLSSRGSGLDEKGARAVLTAAALTYVAAALTALIQLLYLLLAARSEE